MELAESLLATAYNLSSKAGFFSQIGLVLPGIPADTGRRVTVRTPVTRQGSLLLTLSSGRQLTRKAPLGPSVL